MGKENGQQPDPLEVINQDGQRRRLVKRNFARNVLAIIGTGSAIGAVELIGVPKQAFVDTGIGSAGFLAVSQNFLRTALDPIVRNGPSLQEIEQAINRLKRQGKKLGTVKDVFDNRIGFSDQVGEYMLALRIRATKYHLAREGKLDEYERFKWLDTIPIPKVLKPTKADLEEAREWGENLRERTSKFVNELAKRKSVIVQCGDDMDVRTTEVFLFHDENDLWKHETLPLIDVMRGFAATEEQLREVVSIANALKLYRDPDHYEGIYSPKGRQRIADFFGKPVHFYMGASIGCGYANKYGVSEPQRMTVDTIVEHLTGLRRNPYSCIETVETTKAKADKIGLELAKT